MTLENIIERTEFPGESYKNVIWSPDGRWIASALEGALARHRVILWEAASGDIFRIYEQTPVYGGGESVDHIAFSPDSSRLLLAKGNVEIMDLETGELQTLPAGTALSQFAGTGAWSADGVYVAVDYREVYRGRASVLIWNTETGEAFILYTRAGESMANNNLIWAPHRPWLATIDGDQVYILDAEERALIHLDPVAITAPSLLAWSPDGSKLAVGGEELTLEVWELK